MRFGLFARLAGCWIGFLAAGALLPGISVQSWAAFALSAALLALLYALVRLLSRALTLAFDLLLLGLPRLFLEAALLLWIGYLLPGYTASGYWWAMLMLLLGLAGEWLARSATQSKGSYTS